MDTLYQVESSEINDIEIMIKGITYFLPAMGVCENIPTEAMKYWKNIHSFLNFTKMPTAPVKVEEETVQEKKDEIISVPTEIIEEIKNENKPIVVSNRITKPRAGTKK